MNALSFCPHLPSVLPCFSLHRRLSIPRSALLFKRPAPTATRAPTAAATTTTIAAVLPKNKRESVRRHPLDLFHTRAPTSVPDGVAFFQGFSQPQESSEMEAPPRLPLEPTTQLLVIHLLRRHTPVARARPPSIAPHQGVLFKSLSTFLLGFASRTAVKTLTALTEIKCNLPLGWKGKETANNGKNTYAYLKKKRDSEKGKGGFSSYFSCSSSGMEELHKTEYGKKKCWF